MGNHMFSASEHPKPWKVIKDNDNNVSIIDKNGVKVLTMTNHSVLVNLNKKKLSLAKKIINLINNESK